MSENLDALKSAYEAFAREDIPAVLEVFDPDIEWAEPAADGFPGGGVHRGPEAVANEVFADLPNHFDDFGLDVDEWIDAGDTIVVTGRLTGRAKGGGELDSAFAHVCKMRNGKLVRFHNHEDSGRTLDVLRGAAVG